MCGFTYSNSFMVGRSDISKILQSFSRSVEQFFLTICQNNFGNKVPLFFILSTKLTDFTEKYCDVEFIFKLFDKIENKRKIDFEYYFKAPIIRTGHWAVLAVHIMYCRTGIGTGTYNRNFRVFTCKFNKLKKNLSSVNNFN